MSHPFLVGGSIIFFFCEECYPSKPEKKAGCPTTKLRIEWMDDLPKKKKKAALTL